jgi:hypothetical protein
MALVTLEDVRELGGLMDHDADPVLARRLRGVLVKAERFCGRSFADGTTTSDASWIEYHDGGGTYIMVRNPPVVTITALADGYPLTIRTIDFANNVRTEQEYKDQGRVELYNGEQCFQGTENAVRIAYIGGWTRANFPDELRDALCEQVLFEANQGGRIGMKQAGADGVNQTFAEAQYGFAPEIFQVVSYYKLWHREVV